VLFRSVHLHGFSEKSLLIAAMAMLLRKKIVVKFTSVGHDDPIAMRAKGPLMFQAFSRADRFVAVSPRFAALYDEAGLPRERFRLIPNGVDLERFRPAADGERRALRRQLGLPADLPVVLFVGFFSREKCPDLLFDAWTDTFKQSPASNLVVIGASRSDYYEIDSTMAERVRADAKRLRCDDRLHLVEHTTSIEHYYRAADVFVLPSTREGLPNALLEAMACGVPSIVSRLPGVTDTLIADGADGVLVEPGDRQALASALESLLDDPERRARIGSAGRATVASRFSLAATADAYLDLYRELA
jgi:glycosyltransferase involved in cell wall biosynthesis